MKKFFNNLLGLFILLTVTSFGLISHASAMPASMHQSEHGTSHSNHARSSSTRCATLCTSAVVSKEEELVSSEENLDDDEPIVPFYVQQLVHVYDDKSQELSRYRVIVRPPPKVPLYVQHGVFRV